MAVLAILQADARVAARLMGALSADHRVVICASCDELRRRLEQCAFDGCLIDVVASDLERAGREIGILRENRPGLAIVACVEDGHGRGYFDLGEMGVDGVLPMGSVENAKIRAVVDGALATARASRIARTLEERYAAPGPDAIGWAVENAGGETSVEKLAAALGHTPRSLRQALEEAGLPGPTRVLLWGRLLLAGARLGRDGRTVEEVAFSLGYSTATSLARAMKRQTGLTPSEVSEHGGMERVRDALFPSPTDRRGGRHLGKIASVVLLAMLFAGCATLGIGSGGVDRGAIDAVLDAPPLDRAHFGVLAIDAESGRTLYARNDRQWFVPASNQKILVTAAAWTLLGPDFRFRTELWATDSFEPRHLDGDVVLVASGDPSFSARYWPTDTAAFEAIADSLAARGPRHVTGALVVDVSAWDSTSIAPTREVADLGYGYGATGGAFAFAEGEFEVLIHPGATVGALATVEWSPVGTEGYIRSHVTTAEPDSAIDVFAHYLPETHQLVLEGSVERGVTDTVAIAQRDAVGQATAALSRIVARRGVMTELGSEIRWTAGEPVGEHCTSGHVPECSGARLIAVIESPPLSELVAGVLGPSQNWIAEQLTLAMGARLGDGGTWEDGVRVVERFLAEEVGVDTLDVAARDGSGLSAYNLVTPRALVGVLRYMAARDDGLAYAAAMAEPGDEDSTLEDRLPDLGGRVRAKTGSISNVNSLSGYLVRSSGEKVIFAILSNGSALPAKDMRDAIDDVVRVLAR